MGYAGLDEGHANSATLDSFDRSPGSERAIADEVGWRRRPGALQTPAPRIPASRWFSSDIGTREFSAETPGDSHVVGLVLRPMDIRLSVAGRVVQDGVASPGMLHVSEPSTPAQCLFRGPYDTLHLHVPNDLLSECAERHAPGSTALLRSTPTMVRDPVTLQLGLDLLKAEEFGTSFGWIYADGISLAIVTRLLALQAKGRPASERGAIALSKWRLQRAVDYVEAHLDEPVSLAELAAASGLGQMHFAAQFKAATGLRPHDYLLRQRIARAQKVMVTSTEPLVQVCLQVGFQSQAHFTTVFKRIVGQSPFAWRRSRNPSGCIAECA